MTFPAGHDRLVALAALAVSEDGDLPTEIRIFKAGWNDTLKGRALFDEQAARDVLAAAEAWGVDMVIDLEHQSLKANDRSRSDATDARGHFRLSVRDGELWASGVTWTPDGQRRLREKTQRYLSPVFGRDKKTDRVTYVFNAGLVSMPATFGAMPLVAASARDGGRVAAVLRAAKFTATAKRRRTEKLNGSR